MSVQHFREYGHKFCVDKPSTNTRLSRCLLPNLAGVKSNRPDSTEGNENDENVEGARTASVGVESVKNDASASSDDAHALLFP